jgi:hypothetical protein
MYPIVLNTEQDNRGTVGATPMSLSHLRGRSPSRRRTLSFLSFLLVASLPHAQAQVSSFSASDGYHVLCGLHEPDGYHIREHFYNSAAGSWVTEDLISLAKSGTLVAPDSSMSSFGSAQEQHNYFISSTNQVHQLYWDRSTWVDLDLMALANSSTFVATGSGLISFADESAGQHVYFTSSTNKVHQLSYNGSAWVDQDLMALSSSSTLVAPDSGLSSLVDASGGQHVYFVSSTFQLHQVYFDSSTHLWVDQDLMALANSASGRGSVSAGSGLSSLVDASGGQHVFFANGSKSIHQLYYDGSTWADQDLIGWTGDLVFAVQTSVRLSASTDASGSEHIFYTSDDNQIHQLYQRRGGWVDQNLMNLANSDTRVVLGSGLSHFTDASGDARVYFTSTTDEAHQLYYNNFTGTWSDQNLSY